jgi:hypothetical protein
MQSAHASALQRRASCAELRAPSEHRRPRVDRQDDARARPRRALSDCLGSPSGRGRC